VRRNEIAQRGGMTIFPLRQRVQLRGRLRVARALRVLPQMRGVLRLRAIRRQQVVAQLVLGVRRSA
jgi:hypothetical protein